MEYPESRLYPNTNHHPCLTEPASHGFTHLCDYSQQSHKKGKTRKGLSIVNRRFRHCPSNQPLPLLNPLPPEQQMESQYIPALQNPSGVWEYLEWQLESGLGTGEEEEEGGNGKM